MQLKGAETKYYFKLDMHEISKTEQAMMLTDVDGVNSYWSRKRDLSILRVIKILIQKRQILRPLVH